MQPDPAEANRLVARAVAKDNGSEICNLGVLLHFGAKGVPADPAEAKRLLFQAAAKGNVLAVDNLVYLLSRSVEGVQTDPVQEKWLLGRAISRGWNIPRFILNGSWYEVRKV